MTELNKRGRWKQGESGNPKGRKPGTGDVAKLRAAIAERLPELLESLMRRALEGDTAAARLLLERTVAPLRAVEQGAPVALPTSGLTDQARAVLAAASQGELTPAQAAQLMAAIAGLAKVIESTEWEARIAALEANHEKK